MISLTSVELELYKLYQGTTNSVSEWRHKTNALYYTLQTALLVAIIGVYTTNAISNVAIGWLGLVGGISSMFCCLALKSYNQLNRAKFKVLNDFERSHGISFFSKEWEELGNGLDWKRYIPLSKIEGYIPKVMTVVYLALFVIFVVLDLNISIQISVK